MFKPCVTERVNVVMNQAFYFPNPVGKNKTEPGSLGPVVFVLNS